MIGIAPTRIRYTSTTDNASPMAKLLKDSRMAWTVPRTLIVMLAAAFLHTVNYFLCARVKPAQVLALWLDIHVHRFADLVMVHFRRGQDVGEMDHRIEPGRLCKPMARKGIEPR